MISLTHKTFKSSFLLVAIKMLQRLIGLISIMILARLLTPDDFAIIALTSIIIYFFDMLSHAGSEQYIIQKKTVTADDVNTAWTIDLLMKSLLSLILVFLSPLIAYYFDQPKLEMALKVSSFLLIINAIKNPGIFLLKQSLEYDNIFWLSVIQKVMTFVIVIYIAYYHQSYWALIIGDLLSSIIFALGSYYIHPHKPKFTLIRKVEQWSFSKWLLLKSIVGYARSQIDTLVVSKLFSALHVGQYYMARNITMLPCNNLLSPAIEPLLASFSVAQHYPEKLAKQVDFSLLVISIVTLPMVMFIYFFPSLIVNVLLGEKWESSIKLIQFLTLLLLYFPFVLVFEQVLIVKGKVKSAFTFDVFSLALIIIIFIFIPLMQPEDVALYRGIIGCSTTLILATYLKKLVDYRLAYQVFFASFCALCSLIAALLASRLSSKIEIEILALVMTGIVFCCCYLFFLLSFIYVFHKRNNELNKIQQLLTNKLYNRFL